MAELVDKDDAVGLRKREPRTIRAVRERLHRECAALGRVRIGLGLELVAQVALVIVEEDDAFGVDTCEALPVHVARVRGASGMNKDARTCIARHGAYFWLQAPPFGCGVWLCESGGQQAGKLAPARRPGHAGDAVQLLTGLP